MKQAPIKLGPLALLLMVISICLTTLSVLVYTTARADVALAEKYADTVRVRYELEMEGQRFLGELDGGGKRPDAAENGDEIDRVFETEDTLLHVAVRPTDEGLEIISWRYEKRWTEDTDIGNLWNGN